MFKYALCILIALNVIGLGYYFATRNRQTQSVEMTRDRRIELNSTKFTDFVSKEDFVKIRKISDQTEKSGEISNEDLDYLVGLITHPYPSSVKPGFVHFSAAAAFTAVRTFKEGQKQKMMDTCLPLLTSKDNYDLRVGLAVEAYLKDNRGIKSAIPLVTSPDQKVSSRAKAYLSAVGYAQTTSL